MIIDESVTKAWGQGIEELALSRPDVIDESVTKAWGQGIEQLALSLAQYTIHL